MSVRTKLVLLLAIAAVLVALVVMAMWLALRDDERVVNQPSVPTKNVNDFVSCAAAGNPIAESNPRTCRAGGVTYVEEREAERARTMTFESKKGVEVRLYEWVPNKVITSPLTLRGEVPGNWSFEASFPVAVKGADGDELVRQPATLEGEWMTTDFVPFTARLTFVSSGASQSGLLVLHRDNPSGLPENEDWVAIPVTIE